VGCLFLLSRGGWVEDVGGGEGVVCGEGKVGKDEGRRVMDEVGK
jgi:hypothetical protein